MHIKLTEEAAAQLGRELAELAPESDARVKLAYDSEGCGCAVNGVPALWLVNGPETGELQAEGSSFKLLYDPLHEVFFEDELTVDYSPARRTYALRSKQQTYNSMMRLVDKRGIR